MFTIKGNPQLNKENFIFSDNSEYPYFTRTIYNNGILGYVNYLDDAHLIKGNSIAVGMMGMKFFYMAHDFYAGQFTKTAFPKFKGFNSRIALWFISWFNKSSKRYSSLLVRDFENVFSQTEVMVPYHANGDLALDFMEACIQEMEQVRIRELELARDREIDAYLKAAGLDSCELTEMEKDALNVSGSKRFLFFNINSIFDIRTGRDIIISRVKDGNVPLVSHQHTNNGISKRISQLDYRTLFSHSNTLSLADRGVFRATTQAEDFHIGTRVKALTFRNGEQKEEIRLFFVASINKLQVLFTEYLVNATDKLPSLEISLPVTSSGEIDYQFMETYIRAVEKMAIQRVKEWRTREISLTKDCCQS